MSTAQRVGKLPLMVTNQGHPIFLNYDCVISNEQDIQNRTAPRTIVTPKYLNEIGISVYFANGTTVLFQADTVELNGTVIHQEKFFLKAWHLLIYATMTEEASPPLTKGLAASTCCDSCYPGRDPQPSQARGYRSGALHPLDGTD